MDNRVDSFSETPQTAEDFIVIGNLCEVKNFELFRDFNFESSIKLLY